MTLFVVVLLFCIRLASERMKHFEFEFESELILVPPRLFFGLGNNSFLSGLMSFALTQFDVKTLCLLFFNLLCLLQPLSFGVRHRNSDWFVVFLSLRTVLSS